jgi:hypothetical protein
VSDKTPIFPPGITWQPINEWQKCPICEGSGEQEDSASKPCNLCKGKMIISKVTGMPPPDEYKGPTGILSLKENMTEHRKEAFIQSFKDFFK